MSGRPVLWVLPSTPPLLVARPVRQILNQLYYNRRPQSVLHFWPQVTLNLGVSGLDSVFSFRFVLLPSFVSLRRAGSNSVPRLGWEVVRANRPRVTSLSPCQCYGGKFLFFTTQWFDCYEIGFFLPRRDLLHVRELRRGTRIATVGCVSVDRPGGY